MPSTSVEIAVGRQYKAEGTVTEDIIKAFAGVSGDANPLHLDESYARKTRFGRRIAPGMFAASLISSALASIGEPSQDDTDRGFGITIIYKQQTLEFLRPANIGDTLTAIAEITRINHEGIHACTTCRNQFNKIIVQGKAVVMVDPYPFQTPPAS